MRARMALTVSQQTCTLREIVLRDKPAEMIAASAKATVPVLRLPDGGVLEESLDIMYWALDRSDPDQWLQPQDGSVSDMKALIADCDDDFKQHLDRYKYATRYAAETDPAFHRDQGMMFLKTLDERLEHHQYLFGNASSLADFAIFPFVRQFAHTNLDWFDNQPIPNVQRWLRRHLDSELFKSVMKKWPVWKPGDADTRFPE